MTFRPHIPLRVKVDCCLLLLGLDPANTDWDHAPALGLRSWNPEARDYDPPANDPRFIRPLSRAEHKVKTTGRCGESNLSISPDGDVPRIAKVKRVQKKQAQFLAAQSEKAPGKSRERSSRLCGRPFDKTKSRRFDGSVRPRKATRKP